MQETFLAAWRNKHGFRQDASVKTWLFTILKSKLIDHYRKASRNMMVTDRFHDTTDEMYFDESGHWREGVYPQPFSADIESTLSKKEFNNVLKQCRQKLKEIQASVFAMKYIDDDDSDTICRQLYITSANYWVLLHRAKVQLRACLQKNWIN